MKKPIIEYRCPDCETNLLSGELLVCNACGCKIDYSSGEEVCEDFCECGHERKYHGKSKSINYTEGKCSECNCDNFVIENRSNFTKAVGIVCNWLNVKNRDLQKLKFAMKEVDELYYSRPVDSSGEEVYVACEQNDATHIVADPQDLLNNKSHRYVKKSTRPVVTEARILELFQNHSSQLIFGHNLMTFTDFEEAIKELLNKKP